MPRFAYIARDQGGKKINAVEEASTLDELINRLQSRSLVVVSIVPEVEQVIPPKVESAGTFVKARRQHQRITSQDIVLFCRQLATLLGAGVTILKSLHIMAQQVNSRRLYSVLITLMKDMEAGLSLHEGMAKHPKVFTDLWINLVESGEASGNLAVVLMRLATYLERREDFNKKIVSALIYPAILLVIGTVALLFLTVKIIPTFAEIFKGFDIKMPLLTQMLLLLSNFIKKYFFLIIGIVVGLFLAFKQVTSTKQGRKQFETFLFKMPIFGEFFNAMVVERFSSEMSTLIESGVPILYGLEIAEHSVGNLVMGDIIRTIKQNVRDGKSLSAEMERAAFFEPMVVQMLAIGEEIGELSLMFKKINEFYEDYVQTFLARFTAMFEPLMMIFMGGVIGIMVIGMFLPIFQLTRVH